MGAESKGSDIKPLIDRMKWRIVPLSKSHVQALIEEGFNAYYSAPAGKVATALLALARAVLDEATPGSPNDPEPRDARPPICRISPLDEAMSRWSEGDEDGRQRVFAILDAMGAMDPAARAAHAVLVWAAQVYDLAKRSGVRG
ncbi:hypothetical protein [Sorangium cellulosum]|uniref:hypothetical protein n=1 Tax=Sorangium cellulosum TaxID=56 RepID=UPI000A71B0A6|nr:hypothetical protein [Sorangium cellulosum]